MLWLKVRLDSYICTMFYRSGKISHRCWRGFPQCILLKKKKKSFSWSAYNFSCCVLFWHRTLWNLQKQHLQLCKSQPFWKLMSTYNILTFNQPKCVNSYVTYSESLKTYASERIFFVWRFLSLKSLSHQPDFQTLLCKHHGTVLSNFLRVTKCFQLLLNF